MAEELIKIVITGPESTGKSTLAGQLADHYNTLWVPEYAREYLNSKSEPYTQADVEYIARQQLRLEDELATQSEGLLFIDTDLTVIKVWMDVVFGSCPQWIEEEIRQRKYDLHLLMDIDLPWEPDPLREHPDIREEIFERYIRCLNYFGLDYIIISGPEVSRLSAAIEAVTGRIP